MLDPSCLCSGAVVFAFRFIVFGFQILVFAFHPLAASPHGHWLRTPFEALYLLFTFFLPSCSYG